MKEKERLFDKESMKLKSEKMTISQVNENQMSRNELSKKRSLQERGITLIALVVTIIILLILAGVTLNIALSDNGLFSKTQEAAEKYKQAQSDEEEMVRQIATQMYSEYIGVEVTGYNETCNVNSFQVKEEETGSTVTSVINRDKAMRWRIWDFDGTTLRIIGDPTSGLLYLKGEVGYNYGVWTMNNICNTLYSNGKTEVTATNLKRSDIQRVSTYDYTNYKHQVDGYNEDTSNDNINTIHFGEVKEYDDAYYPKMWEENDKEWNYKYENGKITGTDKECKKFEVTESDKNKISEEKLGGDTKIAFKESYYSHVYQQNEFINNKYYDLIFNKTDGTVISNYWLATRDTHLEDKCFFHIAYVNGYSVHRVGAHDLFYSDRNERWEG